MFLFETERLFVRRLTNDDVPAMMAIYADRETVRFVGDSEPINLEDCTKWIDVTDRNFERRGYGMVGLESKDSHEIVGCAGIVHPDQQLEAEVKYAFRKDQWGKGLATEAIRGLVEWGRQTHNLKELIATVAPGNIPSQNVLSKVGFTLREIEDNEDGSQTQVWAISLS